jgi:hypothetical protein
MELDTEDEKEMKECINTCRKSRLIKAEKLERRVKSMLEACAVCTV